MEFDEGDIFAEDFCRVLYVEQEWTKMKKQLDVISKTNVNPRKTKHKFNQAPDSRIKSQKNPQARGDTMTIDERNSEGDERKFSDPFKKEKNQIKTNKQKTSSKNLQAVQGRKKTVSHYAGMNNLDQLVNKSAKLQAKAYKEAIASSNESLTSGPHKRPRQPKQRVETNSKVSSTEKESKKKSKEIDGNALLEKAKPTSAKVSPVKQNKNGNFQVIMKNKAEKPTKDVAKEKAKIERKAKRESVREQIKAAKNKPKPPMVFVGVNEEEIPPPRRNLQRTPPREKKVNTEKFSTPFGGGGVMGKDEPASAVKPMAGPVQRSPPRKIEMAEEVKSPKVEREASPIAQPTQNQIEKKEKLQRSPIAPKSPKLIEESSPKLGDKQFSVPLNMHPMKFANDIMERKASPDYLNEQLYDNLSPQRQNYFHNSPKTFTYAQEPTELNNFEDRVDDLLCETRNKLDDFSPKTEFEAVGQNYSHQFSQPQPVGMYYPEPSNEGGQMNYGSQVQPQMVPVQANYQQVPYQQMAYYQPMPVPQNVMPPQGYVQPMVQPQMQPQMQQYPSMPQQMSPEGMGYSQPQMMPASNIGMPGGQPAYQNTGFYPQPHHGSPQ